MEEKRIQFRPTFVLAMILVLSLVGAFATVNIKTDFKSANAEDYLEVVIEDQIDRSLFEDYGHSEFDDISKFVQYVVREKYVDNYKFTKDFKERNPGYIVVENELGEILTFDNEYDFNDYKVNNQQSIKAIEKRNNIDKLEEPEYKYSIRNNFDEFYSDTFSPSKDYKLKSSANLWFKGTFKDGKYSYDTNGKSLTDELGIEIYKIFDKRLKSNLNWLDQEIKGKFIDDQIEIHRIKELDFFFEVDTKNPNLAETLLSRNFIVNYFFKGMIVAAIAALIALIFTTFTNYKKAAEEGTYSALKAIPVELYGLVYGFFLTIPLYAYGGRYFDYRTNILSLYLYNSPILQYLVAFITILMLVIAVIYITNVLKGIFHDGGKAFVFENSIIIRILKFIWRLVSKIWKAIKNLLHRLFSRYNPTTKAFVIGAYFLFAGLGFIITMFSGLPFLVFLTGLLFLTLLFVLGNRYFSDLREIEEVSFKIAQGDYSTKIDEDKNLYRSMAHNLNVAGDSLGLAINKELKSERLKTELITNVSHDLKTPLTSILNYSQLASDENTSLEDMRKYNKIIFDKSSRLKKLIENLFEVSKVASKNVEIKKMEIDFSEMLLQMAGEWSDKLKEKGISIVSNIQEDIKLMLDGQQTYRILDNVFSNIYKYALENTRVYLDMVKEEECILRIKNISKYPLNISADELLERFTRGDASRATEGSGLGLSIASSLTELQGGKFNIEILGDSFMVEIRF